MRRTVGIGALQKDKERLRLFQQKGSSIAREELEKLTSQITQFKVNLEKFAEKYRKDIKNNAEFRREFQQMCAVAGVDPLRSSTNSWGKLLGFGDFYYELAIKIVEVFLATRQKNGGIITMEELISLSNKNSTKDDILEAIRKLKVLGSNIRAIQSEDSYIIHATPAELNSDHTYIAQQAHSTQGYVSQTTLKESLDWTEERLKKALDELIMEGIIWIDNQGPDGEMLYWFPGLK